MKILIEEFIKVIDQKYRWGTSTLQTFRESMCQGIGIHFHQSSFKKQALSKIV